MSNYVDDSCPEGPFETEGEKAYREYWAKQGSNVTTKPAPTTPRVAESLDDLAVGMVVAWKAKGGSWTMPRNPLRDGNDVWERAECVVILADPPAPPAPDWLVTADACATPGCGHAGLYHDDEGCRVQLAGPVPAMLCLCAAYLPPRPVPEEGPETSYNVCKCGHRERWHSTPHSPTCTGQFGRCECATFVFDHVWTDPEPSEGYECQCNGCIEKRKAPATVPAPHADASELATLRVRDEHYEILLQDNLRLSAELAAANTRIAELEQAGTQSFVLGELVHDPLLTEHEAQVTDALRSRLAKSEATNAALSARLERVRALAVEIHNEGDERNRENGHKRESYDKWDAAQRIRAALGEDA